MSGDQYEPVRVSRRIAAPAAVIFRILADPGMHTALDGTGMLRGAVTAEPHLGHGTGEIFVLTTPRPEGRGFQRSPAGVPVSRPIAEGVSLAV